MRFKYRDMQVTISIAYFVKAFLNVCISVVSTLFLVMHCRHAISRFGSFRITPRFCFSCFFPLHFEDSTNKLSLLKLPQQRGNIGKQDLYTKVRAIIQFVAAAHRNPTPHHLYGPQIEWNEINTIFAWPMN